MTNNKWQRSMYDHLFASKTIGSKAWAIKAEKEADFLVEALNLSPGAKILDLPCGTGRHSLQFARYAFSVTGVDISQSCIDIAKKQSRHKNVKYQIGDMSALQRFKSKFDAVTNLFTSFGYFSTDQENKAVLRGMVQCLKPGGKIVINTINRNFLLGVYKPALWTIDRDTITVQASIFDVKTKYNESYVCIVNEKTGVGTARYHRVRLYSPDEMLRLMKQCGCTKVKVWGDFDGRPLNKKSSTHPIYIGQKA